MTSGQPATRPRKRRRRSRRWMWLGIPVVLLALAAWFAPAIVAATPLRNQIAGWLLPDVDLQVEIGSASLGWLSPVELQGVSARDAEGRPLLEAERIVSQKTLLDLLRDSSRAGEIAIENPTLHLSLRGDGSNLEDALAPLLDSQDSSSVAATITVRGGKLNVHEEHTGENWQAENVSAIVNLPDGAGRTTTIQVHGSVIAAGGERGTFRADAVWTRPAKAGGSPLGSGEVRLQAEELPLEIAGAALQRFAGDIRPAGRLTGKARVNWEAPAGKYALEADSITIREAALTAPEWIGGDRPAVNVAALDGRIAMEGTTWRAEEVSIASDLLNAQIDGELKVEQADIAGMLASLRRAELTTSGSVDLAALARELPQTVRVRESARLKSGSISWSLVCEPQEAGVRLVGRIDAAGLAAEVEGRTISWQQPLAITLAGDWSERSIVVEKLQCRSEFVTLEGSGSRQEGRLHLHGDLNRLAAELNRVIDLGAYQPKGRLTADVQWSPTAEHDVALQGEGRLEAFELMTPWGGPWKEEDLRVVCSGRIRPADDGISLTAATAAATSGGERLDVTLQSPVANLTAESALPVDVHLTGGVARVLDRLRWVLPLAQWRIDGAGDLTAAGEISLARIVVSQANLDAKEVRIDGYGLAALEPVVKIALHGDWDLSSGRVQIPAATLASSSVSLKAERGSIEWQETRWVTAADVAFRGDAARVMAWTHAPESPPPIYPFGLASGRVRLTYDDGTVRADGLKADIENFALASRPAKTGDSWTPLWTEPLVKLTGDGAYDMTGDRLLLAQVIASSPSLVASASGSVSELTTRSVADLNGEIAYDLKAIVPLLQRNLGQDFQLAGAEKRRFAVRGPLLAGGEETARWPDSELTAEASAGWTSARWMGLGIGGGNVDARLGGGAVQIAPLDVAVSEGRLKAAPRVLLNADPMRVELARGKLLENVRISPEMCQAWMQYIAPLLADATRAEGRFSADVTAASLPIFAPADGDAAGTLKVHSAQVGPGPLGRQMILLARQVKAAVQQKPLEGVSAEMSDVWVVLPEQDVPVSLSGRRVHHQGLILQAGDVTIRTQGSVGLDQSLDLIAEIPIRDEWGAKGELLAALRGQVLRFPIRGSVTQPAVDRSALEALIKQLAAGAARNFVGDKVRQELEKLFGPRR